MVEEGASSFLGLPRPRPDGTTLSFLGRPRPRPAGLVPSTGDGSARFFLGRPNLGAFGSRGGGAGAFGSFRGRPLPRLGAPGSLGGGGGASGFLRGRPLPRLMTGASSASSNVLFTAAVDCIAMFAVAGEWYEEEV